MLIPIDSLDRLVVRQTLWDIAKREEDVREQKLALVKYEEAFARIQEGTGIRTIDEMVLAFSEAEDQSFSLVTMINEIAREIEEADAEIGRLREELERVQLHGTDTVASRASHTLSVEAQIESLDRRSDEAERRYDDALRFLERVKPGVHSLFQKVCDPAIANPC